MRLALFALAAALLVAAGSGCHHHNLNRKGCAGCGHGHHRGHGHHGCSTCGHAGHHGHNSAADGISDYQNNPRVPRWGKHQDADFTPGPPMAQYAYPYYTVRAPRDFFLEQPATIGY